MVGMLAATRARVQTQRCEFFVSDLAAIQGDSHPANSISASALYVSEEKLTPRSHLSR